MFTSLIYSLLPSLWHGLCGQSPVANRRVVGSDNEEDTATHERAQKHSDAFPVQPCLETCGRAPSEVPVSGPASDDRLPPPAEEEVNLDPGSLCTYCRTITISSLASPSGHPFHSTWSALKRSADAAHGCPLCAFLEDWTIGIRTDDWSIVPYARFNDIIRVSESVRSRLAQLAEGRLCAVEVFEGAGRGLVAKFIDEDGDDGECVQMLYMGLSLGEVVSRGEDTGEFDLLRGETWEELS